MLGDTTPTAHSFRLIGEFEKVTVREPATFGIEALMEQGKRMAAGGESLFVSIRGVAQVRARIMDNEDGTYTVHWHAPQSGTYHVTISRFGVPIAGCPFTVVAATPEPSAAMSSVSGEGLYTAQSQKTHTFDVFFKDRLGAVTQAVDLDVFVEVAPQHSPRTKIATTAPELVAAAASTPVPAPALPPKPARRKAAELTGGAASAPAPALTAATPEPKGRRLSHAKSSSIEPMKSIGGEVAVASPLSESPPAGSSSAGEGASASQRSTRQRRIRVKVGEQPLVVRALESLDSERIGQLLPGTIVSVLEERIGADGCVRARVALDHMEKETKTGIKLAKAATFFGQSSTHRPQMTDRTRARAAPILSGGGGGVCGARPSGSVRAPGGGGGGREGERAGQ